MALFCKSSQFCNNQNNALYLSDTFTLPFLDSKEWDGFNTFCPGTSFILLSLLRKILNQPRPYERWTISPLIIKDAKGQSMPSRHVFSAVVISVCVLRVTTWAGIFLLILSALLAFCRVLGGVHYPKDVVVGYIIGLIAGSLLFLV